MFLLLEFHIKMARVGAKYFTMDLRMARCTLSSIISSDLVGDKTSKPKWRQVKEIDLYSMREVQGWRHPKQGARAKKVLCEVIYIYWYELKWRMDKVIPRCFAESTSTRGIHLEARFYSWVLEDVLIWGGGAHAYHTE